MKKEAYVQAALLSGIIIMLALVSQRIYVRLDTTQAQTYSLSSYTKALLDNLDSTVTITWCRSYAVDSYLNFQTARCRTSALSPGRLKKSVINH